MNAFITTTLITFVALTPVSVYAESEHAGHHMGMGSQEETPADLQMVDGQVKKVDKAAGTVTLKHGPLVNLNMPAMTMAFHVQDAVWLDELKVGDKIRFMAEQVNDNLTLVHFEETE